MSDRRNRPVNRWGCKPDGDVCVAHCLPLETRHGCDKAIKPGPRVEVFQYLVYNGGFARERTLLWAYTLVGVDGRRRVDGWNQFDWQGHRDKKFAQRHADDWGAFTGWPVVDRGRVKELDEPLREFRR